MDDLNGIGLSQAMNAPNALLQTRRIPRRLEVDDSGGRLQVESYSARIGREEYPAVMLALKCFDERTALPRGNAPM